MINNGMKILRTIKNLIHIERDTYCITNNMTTDLDLLSGASKTEAYAKFID